MQQPDYHGGGITNLMTSIIRARGGRADGQEARRLPAADLADARHLVLLVIDGLGDPWLRRQAPHGSLIRHRLGALTTVFPPTTASAITTYLTGDPPQKHGITGWFTWLQELGCVMTVLPGMPRCGGVAYGQAGIDCAELFGHRPIFARIGAAAVVVSPAHIARSDFNLAHLGPAKLRPFKGLKGINGLVRQIARAVRGAKAPSYIYAYWPGLDTIGHKQGIDSAAAHRHLAEIETAVARLADRLAGTDTALILCADHGQIETDPALVTDLGQLPALRECLRIPLCGEPRAAYCYLRPGCTERFVRLCAELLGEGFELHPSSDLLAQGLFGTGAPHPRLAERIGDITLLARGRHVIHDRLWGDHRPFRQIGVHGGLSAAELEVPLCLWQC